MIKIKSIARFGDLRKVVALLRKLAEFEKMEDDFNPDIDKLRFQVGYQANPSLCAVLAFENKEAVGVALFYKGDYSSFMSGWRVYLEDIFVTESHRGQGILRKLLKPVAELAMDCEIKEIVLSVLDWNENAIASYKKLGAVDTGYRVDEDGVKWLMMTFRDDALEVLSA